MASGYSALWRPVLRVPVKSLLHRVTLLDVLIAKLAGEEPLTKDDTAALLGHAELVASTFVDQCRVVLKLTAGQHDDDEVRGRLPTPSGPYEQCLTNFEKRSRDIAVARTALSSAHMLETE